MESNRLEFPEENMVNNKINNNQNESNLTEYETSERNNDSLTKNNLNVGEKCIINTDYELDSLKYENCKCNNRHGSFGNIGNNIIWKKRTVLGIKNTAFLIVLIILGMNITGIIFIYSSYGFYFFHFFANITW